MCCPVPGPCPCIERLPLVLVRGPPVQAASESRLEEFADATAQQQASHAAPAAQQLADKLFKLKLEVTFKELHTSLGLCAACGQLFSVADHALLECAAVAAQRASGRCVR